MARFFGRNNLPITQNLVGERARYKVNAYKKDRDGLDEKPIVDFNFAERTLYGRIDQELDSVHPNGENIVSQQTAEELEAQSVAAQTDEFGQTSDSGFSDVDGDGIDDFTGLDENGLIPELPESEPSE